MPEDPEIDTDALREKIDEEIEKDGGGAFLRRIALTTAVLAAFAAIASLEAGATVNEALVLKTEATQLQAAASDLWAHYQAKGIKQAIQQAAESPWRAQSKAPPPEFEREAKRYGAEQDGIRREAEAREKERDLRSHEADELRHRHHRFADAVALFQVSIALGAVAALTRIRSVWVASMLIGLAGMVMFASPFVG